MQGDDLHTELTAGGQRPEGGGKEAGDLSDLFGPESGSPALEPGAASPGPRRHVRRGLLTALTACVLLACGAGYLYLQDDAVPEDEPMPQTPGRSAPKEAPIPQTKAAPVPQEKNARPEGSGTLGENARLMNELEAMKLRTRIAREEAEYLKAKQAADAVRNRAAGTPAAKPVPSAGKPDAAARPEPKRGRDRIVSVQGAGGKMWALARTSDGRLVRLEPGSSFSCGRVSSVRKDGVSVRCPGTTLFIPF